MKLQQEILDQSLLMVHLVNPELYTTLVKYIVKTEFNKQPSISFSYLHSIPTKKITLFKQKNIFSTKKFMKTLPICNDVIGQLIGS